jgi:hypothetical protein
MSTHLGPARPARALALAPPACASRAPRPFPTPLPPDHSLLQPTSLMPASVRQRVTSPPPLAAPAASGGGAQSTTDCCASPSKALAAAIAPSPQLLRHLRRGRRAPAGRAAKTEINVFTLLNVCMISAKGLQSTESVCKKSVNSLQNVCMKADNQSKKYALSLHFMKKCMQKVCKKHAFHEKKCAKSAPAAYFAESCTLWKKCA